QNGRGTAKKPTKGETTTGKKEAAKPAAKGETTRRAIACRLADVKPEAVAWLWENRIARKALTIVDGDPGLGKSTIMIDLAARVTRGWNMPPAGGPNSEVLTGAVLLLSAEDHLANTIRPRLDAAGADVTKVFALEAIRTGEEESPPVLPFDLDVLEEL